MNEQTNVTSSTTPLSAAAGAAVTPTPSVTSVDDELVRRRRRRRRRRREPGNTPTQRLHFVLLAIVALLLVAALVGPTRTQHVISAIRHLLPNVAVDMSRRMEVVALLIAGLILIYLTPGVEDRVLRLLGIRKENKRGGRRRT